MTLLAEALNESSIGVEAIVLRYLKTCAGRSRDHWCSPTASQLSQHVFANPGTVRVCLETLEAAGKIIPTAKLIDGRSVLGWTICRQGNNKARQSEALIPRFTEEDRQFLRRCGVALDD